MAQGRRPSVLPSPALLPLLFKPVPSLPLPHRHRQSSILIADISKHKETIGHRHFQPLLILFRPQRSLLDSYSWKLGSHLIFPGMQHSFLPVRLQLPHKLELASLSVYHLGSIHVV